MSGIIEGAEVRSAEEHKPIRHLGCFSCGDDRWPWLLLLPSQERKSQCRASSKTTPQGRNGLNLLYYKMDKKSIVNDLYQVAVISAFAVGYSMLGKKIFIMIPPSIQKFDLEDMGRLVAIITASEMMRDYLIKQKILPEYINI